MYDNEQLSGKLVSELRDIAKDLNIVKFESLKKQELITKIIESFSFLIKRNSMNR